MSKLEKQPQSFRIETERLVLKRLTIKDAKFIFELLNTEGWLNYIGDRGVKSVEAAKNYLKEKVLHGRAINGFGMLLVEGKTTRNAMGICGLVKREGLDAHDIGFAFLPQHSGKGYAFESATAVIKYAKEQLALPKLQAITTTENGKSIHLLEKLGMRYIKSVRLPNDKEELSLFEIQLE
ncbi:MAG: GNAT family N-acetyltransferase [Bacteroidia bacterium]|jgi:RimJ/RimL family protein N-acetyltransferase|nr:GNAT family N-acetyltransferase [Bacteroidia bacterium]